MADRLISHDAVALLLDAKMDKLNALLANPLCRGMDRKIVAAQLSTLVSVKSHLRFVDEGSPGATGPGGEFPLEEIA
jgi:hypothetical protein